MFAIGIKSERGVLDEEQLFDITGTLDNVLIANDFASLGIGFAVRIARKVCNKRC